MPYTNMYWVYPIQVNGLVTKLFSVYHILNIRIHNPY